MQVRHEQVEKHKIKRGKQVRMIEADDSLEALADSLVKHGQLQEIGLLSDYSTIWGLRRHAASMLRPEITHLRAAIFDQAITEQQYLILRAVENFQREELTPYERWQTVEEIASTPPPMSNVQLAEHFHLSPSAITHLRSPGRCGQAAQAALKAGLVDIAHCYTLSQVSEAEQLALLAAVRNGASAADLRHRIRKAKNGTPAKKAGQLRCPLVSGAVVRVSLASSGGIEDAIEAVQDWLKLAKRAVERGWDARTFERACAAEAKAGRPS